MPDESVLQTAFLPSQQSWDAFTPWPQMLPVALQEVPLLQRPPICVEPEVFGQVTEPLGLIPPPQHWSASRHQSPVRRQPVAGWQIETPVPGSRQMREQQPVPELHGLPSWVQPPPPPPVGSAQTPGFPPVAVQSALQQSVGDQQMSPAAWHE